MKEDQKKLGLYVHIPFCAKKCDYCDFYSLPGAEGRMDDYVQALETQLVEIAPRAEHHVVDSIYFGGGTPTLLGVKHLTHLLKAIQKKYSVTKDAEITLEANPESAANFRDLRALRKAGFNRLSLGMQSANDEELQAIGRIHTAAQVKTAVEAARKAKFTNLSLDLIYGLPGQSLETWQKNVHAAIDLAPQHLSCYGLKVEEGTPLFLRQDSEQFPGDDAQAEMYLWTVDCLHRHGFFQYEISNFARTGFESQHNLKYWTLGEYAGFGPGAHSDFGNVRYAYEKDLDGYLSGMKAGGPLLSENECIPPLDRDTEWIMLGLRTVWGLDPNVFENRFRRRFDCFVPFLEECRQAGYAVEEDGRWRLTPNGFLVSNQIIGGMLDALGADKKRREAARARGDFRVDLGCGDPVK